MLGHSSTHWGPVPAQLGHKQVTLTSMRDPVSTDFSIIAVVLLFLDFFFGGGQGLMFPRLASNMLDS